MVSRNNRADWDDEDKIEDDDGEGEATSYTHVAPEHVDPNWDDVYGREQDWPPDFFFDGGFDDPDNPRNPHKIRKPKEVERDEWAHDPAFDLVYSYNELAALKEGEHTSVIDGGFFVVGEPNNVYGQTEIGKSTLLLNAAAHIVSYQPSWLGKKIIRPGRFVLYSAENRGGSIHTKMSDIATKAGIDPSLIDEGFVPIVPLSGSKRDRKPKDPTLFRWVNGKPEWTPMFDELVNVIAKTRPVAFAIDPRSWVFKGNLNDPQQQHEFTSRLKMIAIEYNCACIVTAHPSRAGEIGGYSGHAVGWDADARFEALMRMPKNEAERASISDGEEIRVLELRGNHMERPETLVLVKDGFHFSLANGATPADESSIKPNAATRRRADAILDVLRKDGPTVTRAAIGKRLAALLSNNSDSSGEMVRKALIHLRKAALIEFNRDEVRLLNPTNPTLGFDDQ